MKYSPLQIRGCHFTELKLSSQPTAKEEDKARFDLLVETNSYQVNPESKRAWCVLLNVKTKPLEDSIPPYLFEVEAFGRFEVSESWPEAQIEKLVYINGSGVLYSAAREMICTLTSRGMWDMITLPSWSFSAMYKEMDLKRTEEAARTPDLPLTAQVVSL